VRLLPHTPTRQQTTKTQATRCLLTSESRRRMVAQVNLTTKSASRKTTSRGSLTCEIGSLMLCLEGTGFISSDMPLRDILSDVVLLWRPICIDCCSGCNYTCLSLALRSCVIHKKRDPQFSRQLLFYRLRYNSCFAPKVCYGCGPITFFNIYILMWAHNIKTPESKLDENKCRFGVEWA